MGSLVEIKVEDSVLHIILTGDVTLAEATTVKRMVNQSLGSAMKPDLVILDLTAAGHVYSPALGRLLGLHEAQVKVIMVLTPVLYTLFRKLGIDRVFELAVTVEDALKQVRPPCSQPSSTVTRLRPISTT